MILNAIVVSYKSDDLIVECVKSILAAGITRVIVWDNDPSGSVRDKLEPFLAQGVTYHTNGYNWGFGAAVNRATTLADPSASYLLVNPDCSVTAAAIALMMAEAQIGDVGVVAPRMHYPDGSAGISGGPYPTLRKELGSAWNLDHYLPETLRIFVLSKLGNSSGGSYQDSLLPGPSTDMDWVSGFCFLINREVFRIVQGFDERFFLYFEDVDFCRRVTLAGYRVRLVRELSVLHIESTSTSQSGKSKHYKKAMRTYFKLHGSWTQRAISTIGSL